jgi:hypothetical protein
MSFSMSNDPPFSAEPTGNADDPFKRSGRRRFLASAGLGLAAAGLGGAAAYRWMKQAIEVHGGVPVLPSVTPPVHRREGKQLILVFLNGGVSQIDTFDPKPKLEDYQDRVANKVLNLPRVTDPVRMLPSPFKTFRRGEAGIWVSEIFPNLANVADDLCVLRGMHTIARAHVQAVLMMHNGSERIPLPSLGTWVSYALGTSNPELPSYIVFSAEEPYGGPQVWDSNFLPRANQGVRIFPGSRPIDNLVCSAPSLSLHDLERQLLHDANELYASMRPADLNLQARQKSFDTARGLMRVAPEVFNIAEETAETLDLYGVMGNDNRSFAWQCLMARRLIEQGVRTVELIESGTNSVRNWDAHMDIMSHRSRAYAVDKPLAALIADLKRRSLLKETVVAICTEFGRSPWFNDMENTKGRDHLPEAFTCLLAGAGVRRGCVHGTTDEFGSQTIADSMDVHDYHATILHLLGIDHRQLTYRYAGRDFRLTDVGGRIPPEILL